MLTFSGTYPILSFYLHCYPSSPQVAVEQKLVQSEIILECSDIAPFEECSVTVVLLQSNLFLLKQWASSASHCRAFQAAFFPDKITFKILFEFGQIYQHVFLI